MSNKIGSEIVLPAVVLAGAPAEADMAARYSIEYRAQIPFNGKPMVRHVVDALSASSHVGSIGLVGNIECEGVTRIIPPAGGLMENLAAGVSACSDEESGGRVLVVTSDIPLVTPEAIDDFIDRCGGLEADFYYAIVSRETNDKRFAGMKRTYARLAEGTFTGGNVMVVDSRFLAGNIGLIREMLNARKSVARLARLIGLGVLVRALVAQTVWAGAINIPTLEATVGRILKANVKAVQTPFPEIGADVDKVEHAEYMERLAGEFR